LFLDATAKVAQELTKYGLRSFSRPRLYGNDYCASGHHNALKPR
jgi:hypothetical protein